MEWAKLGVLLSASEDVLSDADILEDMRGHTAKNPDGFYAELINSDLSDRARVTIGRMMFALQVVTCTTDDDETTIQ